MEQKTNLFFLHKDYKSHIISDGPSAVMIKEPCTPAPPPEATKIRLFSLTEFDQIIYYF